ncbi:MAG: ABC-type nitrate/sulfonate/bicarbonate transport system substrate-binding protein [Minisyncoccia bacterium]|jgi:ABC-type nitrate/sulfonate/bicarbonate transport system substrate-binding protein
MPTWLGTKSSDKNHRQTWQRHAAHDKGNHVKQTRLRKALGIITALGLLATACGSDEPAASSSEGSGASIIRFAFAPDPVWDWLGDTGELATWEEANNIRIVTSSTWDEFTYFAGGHGDVVSMGTQEIPVLEQETSIKTVTFGKYNFQRSAMMKRAGDPYETLADVPKGSKICVSSPVSNTGFWTVAAQQLHGLDYRVGGGDYELVVNDHFVNPTNLLRGDCEAAVVIPEAAVANLRAGELELMYDGEMPFQLYRTFSGIDDGENHVMSNLFTATEGWYDANEDNAKAFLALWERGIELWAANVEDIVRAYPQHFAVEEEADVAWMVDFMQGSNDWFVDSVYLDQNWIDAEVKIWDLMKDLDPDNPNVLNADAPTPRFEALQP